MIYVNECLQVIDLQGALDRSMSVGNSSREDYLITKRRVDELNSEVTKLRAQVRHFWGNVFTCFIFHIAMTVLFGHVFTCM